MIARTQLFSSLPLTLALLLVAGSGAAEDVSRSCEAAIDRAAGTYSRCLLGAQSRNAWRQEASKLEDAAQRCTDRFDAATARALARAERGGETCTAFLEAIAARIVSNAQVVATEASGTASPSFLFVQNGTTGGTLSGTTLTLTGVSSETGYFSDRPYREAGHISTEDLISMWSVGDDSFSVDPPNANLACTVNGQMVSYVVELSSPDLMGSRLSYSVNALNDTVLPQTAIACDGGAYLFIDSGFLADLRSAWHWCTSSVGHGAACFGFIPVLAAAYAFFGPAATPVVEVIAEGAGSLSEATELFDEIKAIGAAYRETGDVAAMESAVEALTNKFEISSGAIDELVTWIATL